MKTRKLRIVSLVFAAVLALTLMLPASAAAVYTEGTLYYTVTDESVTITGCFGRDAVVEVPASIAGCPVNTIGAGAFTDNACIRTLLLPDTITVIEAGAIAEGIHVVYNYHPGDRYDEGELDYTPFTDVDADAYYAEAVEWAVRQGVTAGTSETAFSPDALCTRGQIVTFLWRAAGKPAVTGTNPFRDVKPGDYCYEAVLWAVAKGITRGVSADSFAPNAACTRGQIVTFLCRYAGGTPKTAVRFADLPETGYCYNAVCWAVEKGITRGVSADRFAPDAGCTRAQAVTFLYRAAK